ncbi:Crp/Fnr family transcriptional regulator [Muriicola sp.]|uniref:Crp/Fnr family transcriptional regulator n=1 Tax=Muriicola sp. TaxID=2020856 RepID=UPI003C7869BA
MIEQLKNILPENRIDDFLSISKTISIEASDNYIRAGAIPKKIAFVLSGLFRYIYVDDKGNEITKGIIEENLIISSYSAMILEAPSFFSIEALEDSKIVEVYWKDFMRLMENDIFWIKFRLKFVEKGFMIKEKRERDLLLLDAETRYKNFLNEYPGMDQRISQGIIASYLGIKPSTLSRIRKNIAF